MQSLEEAKDYLNGTNGIEKNLLLAYVKLLKLAEDDDESTKTAAAFYLSPLLLHQEFFNLLSQDDALYDRQARLRKASEYLQKNKNKNKDFYYHALYELALSYHYDITSTREDYATAYRYYKEIINYSNDEVLKVAAEYHLACMEYDKIGGCTYLYLSRLCAYRRFSEIVTKSYENPYYKGSAAYHLALMQCHAENPRITEPEYEEAKENFQIVVDKLSKEDEFHETAQYYLDNFFKDTLTPQIKAQQGYIPAIQALIQGSQFDPKNLWDNGKLKKELPHHPAMLLNLLLHLSSQSTAQNYFSRDDLLSLVKNQKYKQKLKFYLLKLLKSEDYFKKEKHKLGVQENQTHQAFKAKIIKKTKDAKSCWENDTITSCGDRDHGLLEKCLAFKTGFTFWGRRSPRTINEILATETSAEESFARCWPFASCFSKK